MYIFVLAISPVSEANIVLGAYFSVHNPPPTGTGGRLRECGDIREDYGIHRVEGTFWILDQINANQSILPNITLGYQIRDSCWYAPVALEQTIEFIGNSVLADNGQISRSRLAAIIGPGDSSITMQVHNILQLFEMPQIGYSATAKQLSDKEKFKYFMRVIASDTQQAQAIVDIIRQFKWSYVVTIGTEGDYGRGGVEAIRRLLHDDVCIGADLTMPIGANVTVAKQLIRQIIRKAPRAQVLVCFCLDHSISPLLQAIKDLNYTQRFVILGSDAWADRLNVIPNNTESVALGAITIKARSLRVPGFEQYFRSLHVNANKRNIWFQEYWQQKFRCRFKDSPSSKFNRVCQPDHESLARVPYNEDPKLAFVINSILAVVHGLDKMHKQICNGTGGLCKEMARMDSSLLMQYLRKSRFTGITGEEVFFDANGDGPGRYDILNLQGIANGTDVNLTYVHVGTWNTGALELNSSSMHFFADQRQLPALNVSQYCSEACRKGHVKKFTDEERCCWQCYPCSNGDIVLDETTCFQCATGFWPNADKTACSLLPISTINFRHPLSIIICFVAAIGIMISFFVLYIFVRFNATPVVKSTTRELSYLILMGILFCHLTAFVILQKPNYVICVLTRLLPGISFSMIYGSLVTKTNRIARILARSKKKIITSRLRFMSARHQLAIACIILVTEICIVAYTVYKDPPKAVLIDTGGRLLLTCKKSLPGIAAPLGFDGLLVFLCTLYAIKTRNLPENFNEAKFIGFSMYTTCVIWIAFAAVYFAIEAKVFSLCVATTCSAYVVLIFLFFPKLYLIIFKPEKNQRSAFATNKDIRCHFGSSTTSKSDMSSYRYSEGSSLFRKSVLHRIRFGNTLRLKAVCANSAASSLRTNDMPGSDRRPSRSLSAYPEHWMYRSHSNSPNQTINYGPTTTISADDLSYRSGILSQHIINELSPVIKLSDDSIQNHITTNSSPNNIVVTKTNSTNKIIHFPDCIHSTNHLPNLSIATTTTSSTATPLSDNTQSNIRSRKKSIPAYDLPVPSAVNDLVYDVESESSSAWTEAAAIEHECTENGPSLMCTCRLLWQLEKETDSIDKFKMFFKRENYDVTWDYVQGSSEV
ncbi:unnamed protein product [Didymodactylos carnosus]|uniref:G-protein coupled receptors family 3 profile domain-containing protein n=1 Tax=Didymodactylos carnosus TaxID=1234261 RepID=A0A814DQ73_9BILA|nr:unnamed protein product [Didymodactylos carnosus]CAF1083539.1 unnamed protein product [Didymodactylos carnosus]CAF3732927.1 unnamed protein product [Didymodactylos carnosus]CAF3846195.1 unnamed protein product [Didymodactylos carnosus]